VDPPGIEKLWKNADLIRRSSSPELSPAAVPGEQIEKMGDMKEMPFDIKRMVYGGFKVLVEV